METPQVQREDVQQVLSGQPVQQVAVGQYVVNIGAVQEGGVIRIAAPGKRAEDRIHPRRERPSILPRPVPGFLDRERELGLVGQALARGQVVDLHGPDGIGKTALISQVMRTQLPSAFPDGMIYVSARHETYDDLLQDLFESFFETDGHVKVTENDVRGYMAGKRALVVVDDANHLEERKADELAQAMPQCAILIAGQQQQVWNGVAVVLRGLPRKHAVALFEQHWGPLSVQDRPTVEAICDALGNVPLATIRMATLATQRRISLTQVLQQVQSRPETELLLSRLSAAERRVLGALAAPGGATVGIEALPVITGLPEEEIARYLTRLQQLGLVQAHSPRYSVDDALRPYIQETWTDEEMSARASDYYRGIAGQLQNFVRDPDEENILAALEYYYRREQWEQVVDIARTIELYLISTKRWGRLRACLAMARRAARKLDDWATEAWAQNQLGMLAMWEEDATTAARFFQEAFTIQQAIGDRVGMKETRQNMQMLRDTQPGYLAPEVGKGLMRRDSPLFVGITAPLPTSERRHLDRQVRGSETPGTTDSGKMEVEFGLQYGRNRSEAKSRRTSYNVATIRNLLTAAFTPQSLRRFCQDHPSFQPVVNDFSPQHSLNDMVGKVIDYCWTTLLWDELLTAVKEEHPRQYADFEPTLWISEGSIYPPAASADLSPADKLSVLLTDLGKLVSDHAPEAKRAPALEKVAALKGVATEQYPDLAVLESVLQWFDVELPPLSSAVLSAILGFESQIAQGGEDLLQDFRRRFNNSW